jgi:hypothetical protein
LRITASGTFASCYPSVMLFARSSVFFALATMIASPLAFAACSSSSNPETNDAGSTADASADDASQNADASNPDAGPSTSIVAFDKTLVCFGNGGTGPCSRTVDKPVTFPTTGSFAKIVMRVSLTCPTNGCDPWDRVGSIQLVQRPTTDGGASTLIELGRFMTPYGIRAGTNAPPVWDIDVTELRPLLSGDVTLRAFIDTWVPQGNAAQYGGGWLVGVSFEMTGGVAAKDPMVVVPIWSWKTTGSDPTQVVYGDPGKPIAQSLPPQQLALPSGPKSWGVRSIITGHGQANLDNCAEFCSRNHTWTVGGVATQKAMWRTDCASFPSSGTYRYSRAGWCPGASVIPWDFDVTAAIGTSTSTTIAYDVDAYMNTCNGSAPDGGMCTGCQSGESCNYDGAGHTQPFYYVSSLLIGFR